MSGSKVYRISPADVCLVRALFARQATVTILDVEIALSSCPSRARNVLVVMAEPVGYLRRGSSRMNVWSLRADCDERVAERMAREPRRAPKPARPVMLEGAIYPSGDPTYFDVDWLGRIQYVGPRVRPEDLRWMREERGEMAVGR